MATDVEAVWEQYKKLEPALHELSATLEEWLTDVVKELGLVDARVSGRVKNVHSFLNKCLLKDTTEKPYEDPIREASDKVGLRVDVVYRSDVDRLVERIQSEAELFTSTEVDDKDDNLGDDRMGYRGVHVDVVPASPPNGVATEEAVCEIQVRTHAQSAWAMAVHPLQHKPPIDLPNEMRRPLFRLTALLELFDEGAQRARDHMMGTEGYPLAIVERTLEASRTQFTAVPYQRDLTRLILVDLDVIPDKPHEAHQLAQEIATFVDENRDKLNTVYTEHLAAGFPVLIAQPEAILIFYLLDNDKYRLHEQWAEVEVPYKYLDELANAWGAKLPTPS